MDRNKLQLIITMVIFGTIGLVRRYIPYSSSLVAFVRAFIGVIFLLILHYGKGRSFSKEKIKKNLIKLIFSGIALGFNWILLFEAYRYTTISVATVSYYMAPVFMILVSPILLDEKITLKKGIASAVAVLGMILVSGVLETGFSGMKGVLFGLGSAVLYATVVLINKTVKDLPANEQTIFLLGFAALSLFPYVLITEDFSTLNIETFPVIMLLLAGILHTGIAYALYFDSIPEIPTQTVALFSYIDPVVAILLSALVLKEEITLVGWIGIIMVLASAIISEVDFSKKEKA